MKLTEFIEKLQKYKKLKLSYASAEIDFVLETKPNNHKTGDYEPLNISAYSVDNFNMPRCHGPSTLTIGFIRENENVEQK